jgi:transposase
MGGADMLSMRRVGLDVHGRETTAVVLDAVSGELGVKRIVRRPDRVLERLVTLERPFQAVYEAGPTGYGLARAAAERGLDVVVEFSSYCWEIATL